MQKCARIVFDTADSVRDGILQQLGEGLESTAVKVVLRIVFVVLCSVQE